MSRPQSRSTAALASPAFLALSCVGLITSAPANAQSANDEKTLKGVTVTTTAVDEVKVERAESPKYTRPLLDTPQTITVIGNKTLQQQNLLTLREVLSTVPGITFGAGEGGVGYGDRINLRGYSANNDISVDGVRSGAVMNRNETYNIEQVEVTNGANSVYSGGGSVGGTINLVTKKPLADDQIIVNGGVGTDQYYRGTIDANKRINDLVGVRINAVYHENDVPGREVEYYKRWGIAPAVKIGVEGPTSLTLQYEHLNDKSMPQYGIPYFATLGGFVPGFNREGYYGFRNVDTQTSTTNSVQGTFSHALSDKVSIRNLSRFENINQYTVTSQPAGTFCMASNLTPTGGSCVATIVAAVAATGTTAAVPAVTLTVPAGYYLPTGGRGTARYIRNQTLYDQIDLSANFDTGGIGHTLVLGGSYLWEKYRQDSGNILRAVNGANPFAAPAYYPLTNIATPNNIVAGPAATTGLARIYGNNIYTGPQNYIRATVSDGEQTSYAAYLFDTVKFTDRFEINGGLRYEKFDGSSTSETYSTTVGAALGQQTARTGPFVAKDNLFSWRLGAVYKPKPNISIYAAIGNSRTPSKGSVDGTCATTTCNTNPESARNYEVGVKADLFDAKLQLAAALFRNERDKYRVTSGDPTIPDQVLDGKSRVDGVALSATGNVTEAWSVFANYTYLDSKVIRSVSKFCLANPGFTPPGTTTATCTNSVTIPDPAAGTQLPSTPKHSGSAFTSYRFDFGLEVGYGLTYQGKFALNPTAATGVGTPVYFVKDYTTHRLMLSYHFTDALSAQLNVQNVTNAKYFTTVRNSTGNSWAQPGVARSAALSVGYTF